ncbi:hypothetical protein F5Y08DRAFT_347844 [Xylaria arbuscula]|nr:hypothetical protein F5Y08DRAFT_347844 [Xylaria arbuscula]
MRLLKVQEDGQLTLTKDLTSNIPPYAILSHTWGPEDGEVSFDDITKDTAKHKSAYKKIQFCANRVPHDGLTYFWVDTCCIDKSNYTELTTAINSMFKWYENATKCYVYLSDVSGAAWESEFRNSKWFTRGWTLQELIAPSLVEFFSLEGIWLGDKVKLRRQIRQITRIPTAALCGSPLSDFSRRERMLWAEGRMTKLEEDRAYSLIGIFEISLPLVYGEGVKLALRRLEEEIDKQEAYERRDRLPDHQSCSVASLPATAGGRNEPCLQSLLFPEMNTRRLSIETPTDDTCLWLFSHQVYQDWFRGQGKDLIFLKGKPGAGKSTLMKEAFRRALLERHDSGNRVAAFLFNGKGAPLGKSLLGLYQSLLYQLLPGDQDLRLFRTLWDEKSSSYHSKEQKRGIWSELELKNFFSSMFSHSRTKRTIVFIDALDECDEENIQRTVDFWQTVTHRAPYNAAKLSVCISMRDFPEITAFLSRAIVVQNNNNHDITTYVEQKLVHSIAAEEPQWKLLKDMILHKSCGVFLWVVLVVDNLLQKWNNGASVQYLLKQLDEVPDELQSLFSYILASIHPEQTDLTLQLFYWAMLAVKPLRLYEWHHILAFIKKPPPSSLQEWRDSDHFTSDTQLEKKIKSLSRGLVEIRTSNDDLQDESLETICMCAGAGSLSLGSGETRIVQVIHESVREFFLKGEGFLNLDPGSAERYDVRHGHSSIMATCLDYINIKELDALIQARNLATKHFNETVDAKEYLEEQDENMGYISRRPQFFDISPSSSLSYSSTKSRHQEGAPDSQDAQRNMPTSITEFLENLQHKHTEISQWLKMLPAGICSDDACHVDKLSLNSSLESLVPDRSEVLLEDHPSLLSYALYELPTHAKLAGEYLVWPREILGRPNQDEAFNRWITLREDSTLIRDFLKDERNSDYFDWKPWWCKIHNLQDFLAEQGASVAAGREEAQSRPRKTRSRSSSVASFSSASSHTGSRI